MKNNAKEVILNLDLPGFNKEDIEVKINKNCVKVKAQKKSHKRIQKKDFFHEEKISKSFSYITTVPEIKPKKAKTKFSKGKLQIILPKK